MYKTFIRPIIYYGLDCNTLNLTQLAELATFEGNIIKRTLNVSTRCHTTSLLKSLKITSTENYLKYMKNSLFTRLSNNLFTNELLEISLNSQINDDIVCELIHLNDIKEGDISLKEIKNAADINIINYKSEKS